MNFCHALFVEWHKSCLVIEAHPDDSLIHAGILQNFKGRKKIITLSLGEKTTLNYTENGFDPRKGNRIEEQAEANRLLGVDWEIHNYGDGRLRPEHVLDFERESMNYDYIMALGGDGGGTMHPDHEAVLQGVFRLPNPKILTTLPNGHYLVPGEIEQPQLEYQLTDRQRDIRAEVLMAYGSQFGEEEQSMWFGYNFDKEYFSLVI